MRIYKQKRTDKNGAKKEGKKYWIETRDHLGKVRRFPALTSKAQSEIFGRHIERLVNRRAASEQPNAQLMQWLSQVPQKFKDHLVKIGLLDTSKAAGSKPLSEHLKDFETSLRAKSITLKQEKRILVDVRRMFDECDFRFWQDINTDKVENWIVNAHNLRRPKDELSAARKNHYIGGIKQFCEWIVITDKAAKSPLKSLSQFKKEKIATDRRRIRRPLTLDEARRLITTTKRATDIASHPCRMCPAERALLYVLAIETGLRANELRTLKVSSFNFETCTVTIEAQYSKHRKEDVVSLKLDTAAELKRLFANKLPMALAFNMPKLYLRRFKKDLQRAGIDYIDANGKYLDFHSLRHTTGTFLAASGVHPKVAQSIMRHGDINLTMLLYTHTLRPQESSAVAQLPDLSAPPKEDKKDNATA